MLAYFCDVARHLVCVPYTVENLHLMAADLGIKRCWWHSGASYPHYDITKRRIAEVTAKCNLVSSRVILSIVRGTYGRSTEAPGDPQKNDPPLGDDV